MLPSGIVDTPWLEAEGVVAASRPEVIEAPAMSAEARRKLRRSIIGGVLIGKKGRG
jgi:hypothetical protein